MYTFVSNYNSFLDLEVKLKRINRKNAKIMRKINVYKRIVMSLLALMVSVGTFAQFAEVVTEVDGINYALINDTKEAVVTYNDAHYFGDITIPSSITYNSQTYSVTSIGSRAFADCGITSVSIPESVTSIQSYAFSECTDLTSITIPNSVTIIAYATFSGCYSLTSVTIPNSVTSIQNYAFKDCHGLTSITIPESVRLIGENAFYQCDGLTSVTIPESVTSIGEGAFAACFGLTSVTVEAGNSV